MNIQKKFYFFIENLCFCSLKIAVCVPKITIISKNCRLKITAEFKNYGLKIPVRVRIYARMSRVCMIVRTPPDTRPAHQRNTRPPEKPAYIGKIADDEKKYKKS